MSLNTRNSHIRRMIRPDIDRVMEIENQCFDDPWTEDEFIEKMRQRNAIGMVVLVEELVVGYMVYLLEKDTLFLRNLAVEPQYQRQGVGTAMINKLRGKLSQQRRNHIKAIVRETNLDALMFLKSQGFIATGVIRNYYGSTDDEDAIAMEFFL